MTGISSLHAHTDFGETSFNELAEAAPVMIWRAGVDKQRDWFNVPWLDYVGRPIAQELGFGWAQNVHEDDYHRFVGTYNRAFDARERYSMVYRLRRHDGEYRHLLDNGAPFRRNEIFAGYFGSCVDVTDQFSQQAHLYVLLAELQHRVKNALQLILGFITLQISRTSDRSSRSILEQTARRIHGVGLIQHRLASVDVTGSVDLAEYLPPSSETSSGPKLLIRSNLKPMSKA